MRPHQERVQTFAEVGGTLAERAPSAGEPLGAPGQRGDSGLRAVSVGSQGAALAVGVVPQAETMGSKTRHAGLPMRGLTATICFLAVFGLKNCSVRA